jgi:predicted MPP superfamily phosphohydrolase
MKKRLKYIGISLGILLVIFVLLLTDAYFIEPRITLVNQQTLKVPHWSKELNGFKIVAISDIHGGSNTMTEEKLRYLAELANGQQPDVILLLGDYVSQTDRHAAGHDKDLRMPADVIMDNLKGLKAKYGVFAVIGNHDWWYDERQVRAELERVGFRVLENEASSFEANGKKVWILGIEDFWKRRTVDIAKPLLEIEPKENIIGITHNPDSFDQTPDSLSILLAGHTHGGQVYLPFYGPVMPVAKKEYTSGYIVHDGRQMFVTKGVGTTGPGIRFCALPEILVLTLEAE